MTEKREGWAGDAPPALLALREWVSDVLDRQAKRLGEKTSENLHGPG